MALVIVGRLRPSSTSPRWQQSPVLKGAQPFHEHDLRVHHLVEASLRELNRRGKRRWRRLGTSEAHLVVGVLKRKADEGFQIRRNEVVLGPDQRPFCFAWSNLRLQ